ncbi:hypothetical protein VTH82DRAFT_1386 [Thermothelomyces myriococcoides]
MSHQLKSRAHGVWRHADPDWPVRSLICSLFSLVSASASGSSAEGFILNMQGIPVYGTVASGATGAVSAAGSL